MFPDKLCRWLGLNEPDKCPFAPAAEKVAQMEANMVQLSRSIDALRVEFDKLGQGFSKHMHREEAEFGRILSGVQEVLNHIRGGTHG